MQHQVEYYNREWSIPDRSYANTLQLSRALAILEEIRKLRVQRPSICELGSGTGWLASMLGSIGDTLGVELSNVAVERARKRFSHVRFECADVLNWEAPPNAFDIVVSHEVIEHVEQQQRYIDVAWTLLKPGGLLVLTTPNARTVAATPPEHRSHQPNESVLNKAQLQRLLETRFTDVHVRTVILGGGTAGLYRVINSQKAHRILARVGLDGTFTTLALRADFGLHLVAVGHKK
jgi:2-polyprenyl-3-methyl-5-hydroxy-6-metoxy-1,4-benzoquinol methylase